MDDLGGAKVLESIIHESNYNPPPEIFIGHGLPVLFFILGIVILKIIYNRPKNSLH